MRPRIARTLALYGFTGLLSGALACNVDGSWPRFAEPSTGTATTVADRSMTGDSIGVADTDRAPANAKEVDLVEEVAAARSRYRRGLTRLEEYYRSKGYPAKAQWAVFELDGLSRVKQFRYLIDAEVPPESLRAAESIPEADALYEEALALMRRGGHGVPGIYREDRMVEAVNKFRELIERFPTSDKIDDAAFFCGEIHKDYLPNQDEIAVKWYERAFAWDSATPHPARFQAAVVYDYRLHNRGRALELYHGAITYEDAFTSNVRAATRRIEELSANRSSR